MARYSNATNTHTTVNSDRKTTQTVMTRLVRWMSIARGSGRLGEGGFDAVGKLEHAVEPGDREDLADLPRDASQLQPLIARLALARQLHEQPERHARQHRHARQVQHDEPNAAVQAARLVDEPRQRLERLVVQHLVV